MRRLFPVLLLLLLLLFPGCAGRAEETSPAPEAAGPVGAAEPLPAEEGPLPPLPGGRPGTGGSRPGGR